jgi:hypothetical protein
LDYACAKEGNPLSRAAIQHEFIAIDEGLGNLLHVNERSPSKNWIVPIGQPQARDMQLVGGIKFSSVIITVTPNSISRPAGL